MYKQMKRNFFQIIIYFLTFEYTIKINLEGESY